MRYLYVMFSHTNTGIGKLIRSVTKSEYNHVSLSLDKSMTVCYSFARRNRNNALVGGFVEETVGRLCDGGDITVKICKVPVTKQRFEQVRRTISVCKATQSRTIYNTYGAMASVMGIHLQIPGAFTCVEFVSKCMAMSTIRVETLMQWLDDYVIYEGSYLKYTRQKIKQEGEYFAATSPAEMVYTNVAHFGDLSMRLLCKVSAKI